MQIDQYKTPTNQPTNQPTMFLVVIKRWHKLGESSLCNVHKKIDEKEGDQFWQKTGWRQLKMDPWGQFSRLIELQDLLKWNILCTKCGIKLFFYMQINI